MADHSRVLKVTPETLTIGIPRSRLQPWLNDGSILALSTTLGRMSDKTCELAVIPLSDEPLAPGQALSSFIASPSNEPALQLVASVVGRPGRHTSPLLLFGTAGCGKTHLLRAMARDLERTGQVLQISADAFSLELASAIRARTLTAFRARMHGLAALLLDDLEALEGREASQNELARTLEAMRTTHAQVVVTARRPAAELEQIQPALKQALLTGGSLKLHPTEWETQVAIVLERVARWGTEARPDVASEIVSKLGGNLKRLDTLLTELMLQPPCRQNLTDAGFIRRTLAQGPRRAAPVSPDAVLSQVTRHFNLRISDLRARARTPRVTAPRQIAMYLLRRHCDLSYPEIGQRLRRHHTTALYAFRKLEQQRHENASLHATLDLLEKELLERSRTGG
ncbi:MAG: DnaA/Hda family protein [Nitrospiraceae bacterium]